MFVGFATCENDPHRIQKAPNFSGLLFIPKNILESIGAFIQSNQPKDDSLDLLTVAEVKVDSR